MMSPFWLYPFLLALTLHVYASPCSKHSCAKLWRKPRRREEARSRRTDEGKCDVCRSHKEQEGWKEKLESRAVSILVIQESWLLEVEWLTWNSYTCGQVTTSEGRSKKSRLLSFKINTSLFRKANVYIAFLEVLQTDGSRESYFRLEQPNIFLHCCDTTRRSLSASGFAEKLCK